MRAVVYRSDTGEIVGVVHGNAASSLMLPPGHGARDSSIGDIGTHRVDLATLTVIEYSPAAKTAYALRPGAGFDWSPAAGQWIDNRTLTKAQADAWQRIKARREAAFAARAVSSAGIAYAIAADKANLADRLASLQAAIAIGAANTSTMISWRDRDNAERALTLAELNLLAAEMGARGQAIYERSWALDAQVQAAASKQAIDAIDMEAGWP